MSKTKKTVLIENNQSAQLACLIKEKTGLDVHYELLKYDGRPFYPEEIFNSIREIK